MLFSSKRIKKNAEEIAEKLKCLRSKVECLKVVSNEELLKVDSRQIDKNNNRFKEGVA